VTSEIDRQEPESDSAQENGTRTTPVFLVGRQEKNIRELCDKTVTKWYWSDCKLELLAV
jgi:hypothetical protein